jgi:hypothetical protein
VEFLLAEMAAKEGLVVIAGNKADFLAIDFVRDFESQFSGDLADSGFFHSAEGSEGVLELVLAEAKEKIRLILSRIATFAKDRFGFQMINDGVVAGGDEVSAKRAGFRPEIAEFEVLIAHHAGIRSATKTILAGKIVDDDFFKVIGLIDDVVGNSKAVSDTASIGNGRGATAFVFRAGDAILRPNLHRDSDDVPAILL